MGNKRNKKRQPARGSQYGPILLVCVAILVVLIILVAVLRGCMDETPVETQDGVQTTEQGGADQEETTGADERYDVEIPVQTQEEIQLDEALKVVQISRYTGIYMEDGSDEIVSGIMMIQVENTAEQDLQLARIEIVYPDMTAAFEVTNLPAGKSVVLLEKSRQSLPQQEYESIAIKNVLYFDEPMSLEEERLKIEGGTGYLDVSNISGEAITGTVYIYYKNSADDLYYGGITYRAKIEGGIQAGETMRVMTMHYSPENCEILMVTCGE